MQCLECGFHLRWVRATHGTVAVIMDAQSIWDGYEHTVAKYSDEPCKYIGADRKSEDLTP